MFCPECGTPQNQGANFCRACGTSLKTSSASIRADFGSVAVTTGPVDEVHYATFGRRVGACLIDMLVLNGVMFVVGFILAFSAKLMLADFKASDLTGLLLVLGLVVAWIYYAETESSIHQATIGKRAVGIRVTNIQGRRISFGRATGRHFGKVISLLILGTGFLMAASTKRRQALHDKLAECIVVRMGDPDLVASLPNRDDAMPTLNRKAALLLLMSALVTVSVMVLVWRTATEQSSTPSPSQTSNDDYRRWLTELRPGAAQSVLPHKQRAIGERRTVDGVTGEWDGKGWRQVPEPSGPAVGTRKTKDGVTGEWNGHTWMMVDLPQQGNLSDILSCAGANEVVWTSRVKDNPRDPEAFEAKRKAGWYRAVALWIFAAKSTAVSDAVESASRGNRAAVFSLARQCREAPSRWRE